MAEWKQLFDDVGITTAEKYRRFENGPIGLISKFYFQICSEPNSVLSEFIEDVKTGKTPSTTNKRFYDTPDIDWFKPSEIGSSLYLYESKNKISNLAIKTQEMAKKEG